MAQDLVLGGFETVGDDDEGEYVLGAGRRGRGRVRARVPVPKWMRATTTQGVSRPEEEMDFLPFEAALFPAAAVGGTLRTLISRPQRPFRGERLIMSAIDSAGASIERNIVINPAIFVGAVQVGAVQGSTPIAAFSAEAFGVRLSMPSAGQGTEIRISVQNLVALAVGVSATVTAVLIGRAMR